MPYRRIDFAPGETYHLYNRGSGREPIFFEEENYVYLLRLIGRYAGEFEVAIVAYCLMPNHYHLLVRQDGAEPAGRLPQRVFNSYTKAVNKRYERSGTLFEGRYRAVHVDRYAYLAHLCRYIHANPVKHGLVSELEAWPYSNYHEWVGARGGKLWDRSLAHALFQDPGAYRQFVADYVVGLSPLPDGIGSYLLE